MHQSYRCRQKTRLCNCKLSEYRVINFENNEETTVELTLQLKLQQCRVNVANVYNFGHRCVHYLHKLTLLRDNKH